MKARLIQWAVRILFFVAGGGVVHSYDLEADTDKNLSYLQCLGDRTRCEQQRAECELRQRR